MLHTNITFGEMPNRYHKASKCLVQIISDEADSPSTGKVWLEAITASAAKKCVNLLAKTLYHLKDLLLWSMKLDSTSLQLITHYHYT